MEDHEFRLNIVVVGLGLIGSSFAMALRKLNPKNIWGIDKDKNTIDTALNKKIIDGGFTHESNILKKADLTIIALYPECTVEFVRKNIKNFKRGSIIIDTCGIKVPVIEKISSFLPHELEFIGTHPMAGREKSGIESASECIFNGANYIITPTSKNKKSSLEFIRDMAKGIGFKNIVYTSPEKHDDMISFTSQMPHILAASLIDSSLNESDIDLFIGGSFKDVTRIAVINSALWSELFTVNSDKLIDKIEKFQQSLEKIKQAIKVNDKKMLYDIFEKVTAKRKEIF